MTKQELLSYCAETYGTTPDHPFEDDFVTTVLRHRDTKKWYGIIMELSRSKLGLDSGEAVDVINLKLPLEMYGSFGKEEGVYPAYHMNKLHWISVILQDASEETLRFLVNVSYESTKRKNKLRQEV
ncbi:MAG: MmcQ/YjbR family DNA-binding protein [Clostridia bacterium]|nr:MmcQ/YjbR family DNA-binding protein [Clostridia bacterium]